MFCSALALTAHLIASPGLHVTAAGGGGPGFSPNSTVTYGVPMLMLTADVDFGGWYAGGGLGLHTFIEPRFFLEESLASRGAVDIIARVGIVPIETDHLRLLADVSLIPAVQYISIDDGQSFYAPLPSGAATVRGEFNVTDDIYLQLSGGLFVAWASFGLIEYVPHALIGIGARFDSTP